MKSSTQRDSPRAGLPFHPRLHACGVGPLLAALACRLARVGRHVQPPPRRLPAVSSPSPPALGGRRGCRVRATPPVTLPSFPPSLPPRVTVGRGSGPVGVAVTARGGVWPHRGGGGSGSDCRCSGQQLGAAAAAGAAASLVASLAASPPAAATRGSYSVGSGGSGGGVRGSGRGGGRGGVTISTRAPSFWAGVAVRRPGAQVGASIRVTAGAPLLARPGRAGVWCCVAAGARGRCRACGGREGRRGASPSPALYASPAGRGWGCWGVRVMGAPPPAAAFASPPVCLPGASATATAAAAAPRAAPATAAALAPAAAAVPRWERRRGGVVPRRRRSFAAMVPPPLRAAATRPAPPAVMASGGGDGAAANDGAISGGADGGASGGGGGSSHLVRT